MDFGADRTVPKREASPSSRSEIVASTGCRLSVCMCVARFSLLTARAPRVTATVFKADHQSTRAGGVSDGDSGKLPAAMRLGFSCIDWWTQGTAGTQLITTRLPGRHPTK